ncbi:hypothetical protein RP20_CCG017896 [Aedes albopictus]|nr:hypothetical protein RP20_CCG019211 [Aedes albopictus]KXJ72481.1 hypothetical protein RP20_CCG017896 [Aedes albopictus]
MVRSRRTRTEASKQTNTTVWNRTKTQPEEQENKKIKHPKKGRNLRRKTSGNHTESHPQI